MNSETEPYGYEVSKSSAYRLFTPHDANSLAGLCIFYSEMRKMVTVSFLHEVRFFGFIIFNIKDIIILNHELFEDKRTARIYYC